MHGFSGKNCLKMKDVKENSVQGTDWDSNRECLKFDKVGKHSNSTKIIMVLLIIIIASYHENALFQFTLKYITPAYQILQAKPVFTGINFAILFRVCS